MQKDYKDAGWKKNNLKLHVCNFHELSSKIELNCLNWTWLSDLLLPKPEKQATM